MQFLWWFKWWLLYWRWLCWWGWWITIGWARMMKQSWVKWWESSLLLTCPPPPVSATPLRVRGENTRGVRLEREKLVEERWCSAIPFHSGAIALKKNVILQGPGQPSARNRKKTTKSLKYEKNLETGGKTKSLKFGKWLETGRTNPLDTESVFFKKTTFVWEIQ